MNEEIGMKDLWIMVSKILDNFWESIVLNHGIKKLMELIHGPEKMYGTYSVWTVELNHGLEKSMVPIQCEVLNLIMVLKKCM